MAITQSAPASSAWRARSTAWSVPGMLTWTMTGTLPATTATAVLARSLRSSMVRLRDSARCRLIQSDDALCRSRNSMTRLNVSRSTLLSGVKGVTGTWMIPRGSAAKGLRSDIGSDSSYHFSMQHVLAARAARWTKFKCAARQASRLERHDLLRLGAEPVDAEFDQVAGFEINRRRLHAERDARRRTAGDHVARLEHEKLRAIPDDVRHIEH